MSNSIKTPEIKIFECIEGAKHAKGFTVIIDVFRAFSLEPYLFSRGTECIYAVGKEETARDLKKKNPNYILIGERSGFICEGFDFGNSPSQTSNFDFKGKTVVHTTSAGTQGIINAKNASEIITGSLVNSKAIANYILNKNPENVSLVCMGWNGVESAPEDTICANYIKSIIEGKNFDMKKELEDLKNHPTCKRFFEEKTQKVFPEKDFYMCTDVDKFNFVLKVEKVNDDVFKVNKFDMS
jgi:2-phosphosulfolactate phosphatase